MTQQFINGIQIDHDYLHARPLMFGDRIVILGAWTGDFMRAYKQEIIDKHIIIYNFEPDLRMAQYCQDFIYKELPHNAVLFTNAVGDKTALTMFINKEANAENHLISMWKNSSKEEHRHLTFALTLEHILNMLGRVNCIFCDIEGAEYFIFRDVLKKSLDKVDYLAISTGHKIEGIDESIASYLKNLFTEKHDRTVTITKETNWNNEEVLYVL